MNNTETVKFKALKAIKQYKMIKKGSFVVVGLSGGADSVCLLHFLNSIKDEYELTLVAAHVNHGIRGEEALRDAAFSEEFSKKCNVDFSVLNADCVAFSEENSLSLEESGRKIRYSFFESLKKDENTLIATAHNSNDNAETIIFNLSRGTALSGVSGVPPKRDNIIRPLIFCTRSEIEGYCKENSLEFMTDSTNSTVDYSRNRIRHNVLPELEKLNSNAVESISRFSVLAREDDEFLNELAIQAIEQSRKDCNSYFTEDIIPLKKPVKSRVVALLIKKYCNENIDNKKIEAVLEILSKSAKIQLYKDCYCMVDDGVLSFFTAEVPKEKPSKIKLENVLFSTSFSDFNVKSEKFNDNLKKVNFSVLENLIDCDTIEGNLVLRTRENGDSITLKKRNVTKTLKKLFNESNVPVTERDFLPVLSDNSGIVWVYKFGTNKRNFVTEKSKNIICVEVEKI